MSTRSLVQGLRIGAILVGISLPPSAILLAYSGYYTMVPRYSSVAQFDRFGFNLRLDLYLTDDEALDSGRYLTVINGGSYQSFMLQGWDWAHRARTSLYRIDDNRIAALSAFGYDYQISMKPFSYKPVVSDSGAGWQYLGAFDFVFRPGAKAQLQFLDDRLLECIPMGKSDPASWANKPRPQARQASCPTPPPNLGD